MDREVVNEGPHGRGIAQEILQRLEAIDDHERRLFAFDAGGDLGQRVLRYLASDHGAEVGILLPFSRTHESEADVIGMMYMAEAGYPPAQSIDVWDRMAASSPSNTPVFLSTHPSHGKRKENLREWMPQARKKYERNKRPVDTVATLWASR